MKQTEKEWLEDFREFLEIDAVAVPPAVSAVVLNRVRADLNPSPWLVFAKLLGIHAVSGTLSLAVCNQFGLNPFHTNFSLSDYFMTFGHSTCMVLCGVLFIGLTIALGRFVLRGEELLVLAKNAPLQIFGLSAISLAAFVGFGAEVLIGFGLLWLAGAVVGGIITTKVVVRRHSFV